MLVVTRKEDEVVWIGDIAVRVQKARCGRATIAIDAPDNVKVLRHEVRERIRQQAKEEGEKCQPS